MELIQADNPELDKEGNPRRKRGPKPIDINWDDFDKLCTLHCTLLEIAGFFECSPDTIERACKRERGAKFADIWRIGAAKGKIAIRRKALQRATIGNSDYILGKLMDKWLGFGKEGGPLFDTDNTEENNKKAVEDYAIVFIGSEEQENTLKEPGSTDDIEED